MKLTYEHIPGTLALLDGDILTYRIGFTTESEAEEIALIRMNAYIDEILHKSKASDYQVFLTGSNNFRKDIFPEYKANRTQPKPKNYEALRNYLIEYEMAIVSDNQEADDDMGIYQCTELANQGTWFEGTETIICSIDKDLQMIPGRHFNFVKNKHSYVTEEEGLRNFYRQLLTGDTTDNIPGLPKIGPKTAEKLLGDTKEEDSYKEIILANYTKHFGSDAMARVNLIGKLIWIRRKENEEWSFG
jgi:5'-3' exonuclease